VRRCPGRGALGFVGSSRYRRLCFREVRAEEDWMSALVAVLISEGGEEEELEVRLTSLPLDGDIFFLEKGRAIDALGSGC